MTGAVPEDLRPVAEAVSCSAICDAMMRLHGHRAHITDLVSPVPERWLLGPAVTMQFLPLRADLLDPARHDFSPMLDAAVAGGDPAGAVLVVSSWGHPDQPVAGGKKLSRLRNLGLAGLVADARLRDFAEVVDLGIGAWCRGETVRQGGHEIMPWAAGVPVAVGGVTVIPGDWVYADASGAVVIPAGDLRAVLEEAAAIEERDAAAVERMCEADARR
ncbi:MAG: RraA family protein [Thermoleophilia bacterium]